MLPCLSKLIEKLILKRITSFLDKHEVIQPHQFGFRKKHSTIYALLDTLSSCYDGINEKKFSSLIMIDLRKAFDTVCHKKLLIKLEHYGIRGIANELIASYLKNRKQFVSINGIKSNMLNVKIGVPQGSILGPLLYVIYVNDITNALNCMPRLYTDDTCLVIHEHKTNILEKKISVNVHNLKIWLDANELTLNLSNTACLIIPPTNSNKNQNLNPIIDNKLIKVVSSCRYLSVFIDNQLSFKIHIKNLENKLSCGVGVLWKLSRYLCEKTMTLLYHALIKPHLLYAISIWGSTRSTYKNRQEYYKTVLFEQLLATTDNSISRLLTLNLVF